MCTAAWYGHPSAIYSRSIDDRAPPSSCARTLYTSIVDCVLHMVRYEIVEVLGILFLRFCVFVFIGHGRLAPNNFRGTRMRGYRLLLSSKS